MTNHSYSDSLSARPRLVIGLIALICVMIVGKTSAQEPPPDTQHPVQTATYPAGLDDPSIELEELQLRLIPLTLEDLDPLAAAWLDHSRAATQAAVDMSLEVRAAQEGPEQEALREKRLILLRERGHIFDNFLAVVAALEAKGGDPADVTLFRTYVTAILSRETSSMTLQEFTDSVMKWMASPEGGLQVAFRLAVIAGSMLALFVAARIARSWATWPRA